MTDDTTSARATPDKTGMAVLQALGAFAVWGILPLYLKAVGSVPAVEVLAHRVVWSLVLLAIVIAAVGRTGEIVAQLRGRIPFYLATTALISVNWGVFIWAVGNGHTVEGSLGYYINPLVNVVLGVAFLGERLNRRQGIAVALAALGVAIPVTIAGVFPWISLTLATSFGVYALLRKKARIDPLVGLLLETALLTPIALGYLLWLGAAGTGSFMQYGFGFDLFLVLSGPLTAIPLLLFNAGARHLRLSTIGLMQYVAPTLQLILALFVFHEPFTTANAVMFVLIWAALAVYSLDAWQQSRRAA